MITGERVSVPTRGFNPTFQRHVAAYRLCAPLLPEGRVLDLGAFNYPWHDLTIGAVAHMVLLVVGYAASVIHGKKRIPRNTPA